MTLHVWGPIYYGIKLPLYRFQLTRARTINGRKVAAQTITGDVYMRQVLAGSLETMCYDPARLCFWVITRNPFTRQSLDSHPTVT